MDNSIKFSIVLPIHNEYNILKYTLKNIYDLDPSEIIFGLDRCTDNSEKLIKIIAKKHPNINTRIKHFNEEEGQDWGFRPAYLRRILYYEASNDIILNTSADLFLDPIIKKYLPKVTKHGLICFYYYDKPWNIQNLEKSIINRVYPYGLSGILAFSRDAWLKTENLNDLKKIRKGEDTHLQQAIRKKYSVQHKHTHSLHLRPRENPEDQFRRGVAQYEMLHYGSLKAFIHNALMLRPFAFMGFRHAKQKLSVLDCGHIAKKSGELNGKFLCAECMNKFAEEYAYRIWSQS